MYGQKTAYRLIFCKIEIDLLEVDIDICHLIMQFKLVKYQMSHCYLCSKSKANMKKLYLEDFIADYF